MQTPKGKLSAIMIEEGFELIPNNQCPSHDISGPIQVKFNKTAEIIWKLRGEQHLRFILQCLKAHRGKLSAFKRDVLWSLSDILAVNPNWVDHSGFKNLVQTIDLAGLRDAHAARRPWPVRSGVRNDLMNHLEASLNAPA